MVMTNRVNKDKIKELLTSGKYTIFKRKRVIYSYELPSQEEKDKQQPLDHGLVQLTEKQAEKLLLKMNNEEEYSDWIKTSLFKTNIKPVYYYEQYSYYMEKANSFEKNDKVKEYRENQYFSHYCKLAPWEIYQPEKEYLAFWITNYDECIYLSIDNEAEYNEAIKEDSGWMIFRYEKDMLFLIENDFVFKRLLEASNVEFFEKRIIPKEETICSSLDKEKYFSNYLKMTSFDPYWEENEYIALYYNNNDKTYNKFEIYNEDNYVQAVKNKEYIVLRYSGKDVYYPVEDEFSLQCLKMFEKEIFSEKKEIIINYFYIKDNSFTPFETLEELKNYCFNEKNYVIYIKNINNNNLMSLEEESVSYSVSNPDFKCETSTINYTTMSYKIDYTQIKIRNRNSVKARWNVKEGENLTYASGVQYRSHYRIIFSWEEYDKDIGYIALQDSTWVAGGGYKIVDIINEETYKGAMSSGAIIMCPDGNNYHNIWNKSQFMCFKLNKKEGNIENDNIEAYELVDPKEGLNIPSYEAGTYYLKESNKYMLIDSEIEFNNILNNTNIYEIYKKSIEVKATAKSVEQADSYTFLKGKNYYKANSNSNNWSLVSPSTQYQFTSEAKKEKTLYLLEEDSDANFSPITGWNFNVTENPAALDFWIDFMDVEGEMGKYQVSAIGDRIKNTNDDKITAIYFNNIPDVIFATKEEIASLDFRSKYRLTSGYSYIQVDDDLMNCFSISGRGKSAKEELDNLLYSHSYCAETITLTTLPVYYLQPNTRILVRNDETKINGEYIINRMTLPLNYNGTSSITAVKAVERLY